MHGGGLGWALGHLRSATAWWVAAVDPSGESLFLAAEGLEVEALFAAWGVVPEEVDPVADPLVALQLAIRELDAVRPTVPVGLWAAVHALQTRAER